MEVVMSLLMLGSFGCAVWVMFGNTGLENPAKSLVFVGLCILSLVIYYTGGGSIFSSSSSEKRRHDMAEKQAKLEALAAKYANDKKEEPAQEGSAQAVPAKKQTREEYLAEINSFHYTRGGGVVAATASPSKPSPKQEHKKNPTVCPKCGSHDSMVLGSNRKLALGRAVVGDAIAGAPGAIMGATTGKRVHTQMICRSCGTRWTIS